MEAERGHAPTTTCSVRKLELILKGDETVLVTASADIDTEAGKTIDQAPPASSI